MRRLQGYIDGSTSIKLALLPSCPVKLKDKADTAMHLINPLSRNGGAGIGLMTALICATGWEPTSRGLRS